MARNNTFTASDGKTIHYYSWIPKSETLASVLILHGMAEHAGRYDFFAKYLNRKGYSVYGINHRGHGKTIEEPTEQGFFAEKGGWFRVADDILELTSIIREQESGKPIVLFGHSMGSFLALTLMIRNPDPFAAFVMTGTAPGPGLIGKIGKLIARQAVKSKGSRTPNPKLDHMSFGSFGKEFAPNRTKFDWLSSDPAQVDAYVKDPLCGFVCSSQFFVDLLTGLEFIRRKNELAKVRRDLPVLIASGAQDPVGGFGKGVQEVAVNLKKAGVQDVTLKLYDHARHEILNETNRDEVFEDIERWIRKRLPIFQKVDSDDPPEAARQRI